MQTEVSGSIYFGQLYEKFTHKKSFVSLHNGFQPTFILVFSLETFNCVQGQLFLSK